MTRIIIAGCKDFDDYKILETICENYIDSLTDKNVYIISGGAKGADSLGEKFAYNQKFFVKKFIPKWDKGKDALNIRNKEMVSYAAESDDGGHLIVFWDGKNKGIRSLINLAEESCLRIREMKYKGGQS